jgi:hypothetical protein
VVCKVETSVHPQAVFADFLILLRVYWPLTRRWDVVHLYSVETCRNSQRSNVRAMQLLSGRWLKSRSELWWWGRECSVGE